MKIEDLAGNKIAVYDSSLERFSCFCRYLENLGYIWHIEFNCKNFTVRPCAFITSNNMIIILEITAAVKENFLIVPTLSFDDFAEYERRWASEQAEKIKELLQVLQNENN